MPVVGNRIKVASSSTGTGNITLGSAEDGYQTFAAGGISNNDVVRYVITEGSAWEIGKGTYLTSGPSLVRTSGNLLESSTGSLLDLGGSATVFVSLADVDVMQTDGGTFTGDVTFTGDTYNVLWDKSTDDFVFDQGAKLDFGGGANIHRDTGGIFRVTGPTASDTYFNFNNNLIFYRGGSAAAQLMYSSGSQRFHAYGNITVGGTVDGRDVATDGTKLDGIATGADVTPSWVPASDPSYLTAHPTITAASSVDNSGRTYIQDITLDANGHVTGITSATETVTNTDTNYTYSIATDVSTGSVDLNGANGGSSSAAKVVVVEAESAGTPVVSDFSGGLFVVQY